VFAEKISDGEVFASSKTKFAENFVFVVHQYIRKFGGVLMLPNAFDDLK
jgi:hypothetical protein